MATYEKRKMTQTDLNRFGVNKYGSNRYSDRRKRARERWRKSERGKKWTQEYMREYRSRPEVKARYHEYYVKNKMNWGRIKKAKDETKNIL